MAKNEKCDTVTTNRVEKARKINLKTPKVTESKFGICRSPSYWREMAEENITATLLTSSTVNSFGFSNGINGTMLT